jgi:hypothetical protein
LVSTTRRIAIASIFGAMILAIMGFVPAPTSDYLIVFQSFFLALSFLVVEKGGATYVGAVSGLLITAAKPAFFPFDLAFSLLFGLTVDALGGALHAKDGTHARIGRVVGVMTVSTGVVGFIAYYLTAVALKVVPSDVANNFLLDSSVLIFGIVSGAIGGYAAGKFWNTVLRPRIYGQSTPAQPAEG